MTFLLTGMNVLQFTYLMAWWCHNCITFHIMKLQLWRCYLPLIWPWPTASRSMYTWSKQLFATFA